MFNSASTSTSFTKEQLFTNPGAAYSQMHLTILSISRRILKLAFLQQVGTRSLLDQVIEVLHNDLTMLELGSMNFELEFNQEILQSKLSNVEKNNVVKRCFNFIKKKSAGNVQPII